MENAYDRRERTIYVSGMHRSVTEEHLYDLFQKAGPIEKVILKENQDGSPQHALVVFKNVDSVMYSIAYLQATQIGDLSINIRPLRESSHHTALESAMVRMAGGTSQGAEPQSPTSPTSHQAPYNLRSHARAQQQAAASGYPPLSPQPHYSGPLGASLFAPMTLQGAYSGASSFYSGGGSSGHQFGQPMSPTFGQSFRASAQAAPGYGRYSDPYASNQQRRGPMGDQGERDRTVYITGLNHRVTKEHIYELFTQAGPVEKVVLIEKDAQKEKGGGDKREGSQRGFTFALVEFKDRESVPFSIAILNGIELYGQPIVVKPREGSDHGSAIEEIMRLLHGPAQGNMSRNNSQQQHHHHHQQPPPLSWSRTHPMDVRGMMGPPGGTPYASPLAGMFTGFTPPPPPPPEFHRNAGRQHSHPPPLMAPRRDRGESWEDRGYEQRYNNNGGPRGGDFRHAERDSRGGGRDQPQWAADRRGNRPQDDRDYRQRENRGDFDRDRRDPYPGPNHGGGRRGRR